MIINEVKKNYKKRGVEKCYLTIEVSGFRSPV